MNCTDFWNTFIDLGSPAKGKWFLDFFKSKPKVSEICSRRQKEDKKIRKTVPFVTDNTGEAK